MSQNVSKSVLLSVRLGQPFDVLAELPPEVLVTYLDVIESQDKEVRRNG